MTFPYSDEKGESPAIAQYPEPMESAATLYLPDGGAATFERGPPVAVDVSEKLKFRFVLSFGVFLIILAFAFNSPKEILYGSWTILKSPANLITDYFQLANIGATLLNAGVMTLTGALTVQMNRAKITGPILAALFTVAGFSFFGKNLYNSIPIILGVVIYSKISRQPFERYLLQAMFGTALGPLVSEVTFNLDLPIPLAVSLGMAAGILVGILLPPLSVHLMKIHRGFNLYNTGFTAGLIGTFFMAVFNTFGIEVETVSILSSGNNRSFSIILAVLFAVMFLFGLYLNRWRFSGFDRLLAQPGKFGTDFIEVSGLGLTLINMAILGFLVVAYVLGMGGELNGPVIGGIFTVVGFGAFGKHIKNVVPIVTGVFLVNLLNVYDPASTIALMGALFGTTLAPIAGYYGAACGVVAGILHMALVMNVSYLHGGMNLYNNGFSGGLVAALLVPVLDMIIQTKNSRKRK